MLVDCKRSDNTSVDLEMDSGDAITLVLEGDIKNNQVGAGGSSLTVSINDFSDITKTTYGVSSGDSRIQWSDSLGEATVTLFEWVEYDTTSISSTSYRISG